jgi:hypothetical protein
MFTSLIKFCKIRATRFWSSLIMWQIMNVLNVYGSVHRNNVLIYIQQDATLHSLFYLETALHVSGCTSTHHQERKQLYLLLLLPAAMRHIRSANNCIYCYCYLPLCGTSGTQTTVSTVTATCRYAADSSNGVTNTRCCRYSCLRS